VKHSEKEAGKIHGGAGLEQKNKVGEGSDSQNPGERRAATCRMERDGFAAEAGDLAVLM
jgi:hypothetical protein